MDSEQHGSSKLRVIVSYRIPYSAAHPISTSVFLDEFPANLESDYLFSDHITVLCDLELGKPPP